ncbi:hypothetical protein BDW74DRAFT_172760 [Aspergillus multicolor]|uniref:uncharacterized protein n=1 Tax=Aspergillus multicolor TaxID=41759 RepID=UPI003CCCD538
MPHLPELSKKEPSTGALIDNYKSRGEDIENAHHNNESRLAEGVHYDRNKASGLQEREKASTEKVNVEGGGASSSMVDGLRRGNPSGVV